MGGGARAWTKSGGTCSARGAGGLNPWVRIGSRRDRQIQAQIGSQWIPPTRARIGPLDKTCAGGTRRRSWPGCAVGDWGRGESSGEGMAMEATRVNRDGGIGRRRRSGHAGRMGARVARRCGNGQKQAPHVGAGGRGISDVRASE
jgi:hypothetical protein